MHTWKELGVEWRWWVSGKMYENLGEKISVSEEWGGGLPDMSMWSALAWRGHRAEPTLLTRVPTPTRLSGLGSTHRNQTIFLLFFSSSLSLLRRKNRLRRSPPAPSPFIIYLSISLTKLMEHNNNNNNTLYNNHFDYACLPFFKIIRLYIICRVINV